MEEDNSHEVAIESLTVADNVDLEATVRVAKNRGGGPVTDVPVDLQYNTFGGRGTPAIYTISNQAQTGGDGRGTITGNVGSLPRNIAVKAKAAGFEPQPEITTVNFDKLPSSFLSGLLSTEWVKNRTGLAMCEDHGRILPRINGRLNASAGDLVSSIDGFGSRESPWPTKLPSLGSGNMPVLYLSATIDLRMPSSGPES